MPCSICDAKLQHAYLCQRHGSDFEQDETSITVVYANSPSQDADWSVVLVPTRHDRDVGVFVNRVGEFGPVWGSSPSGTNWRLRSVKSATVTYGRAQITLHRGQDTVTGIRNVAKIEARLSRGDDVDYAFLDFSSEETGYYCQLGSADQVHWFEPAK